MAPAVWVVSGNPHLLLHGLQCLVAYSGKQLWSGYTPSSPWLHPVPLTASSAPSCLLPYWILLHLLLQLLICFPTWSSALSSLHSLSGTPFCSVTINNTYMPRTPNLYVRIWPSPTNPDSSIQQSVKPRMSISNHHCRRSVAQSCPTLCDPMDYSTPGLPVLHHLPEFAQTHVYWFSDAIQPSHPLSSPSPYLQSFPASGSFPVSQFFASDGQSIGASASASVLTINIQGWLPLGLTGLLL